MEGVVAGILLLGQGSLKRTGGASWDLTDTPHMEEGVAVPLRVVGDGQAGLPTGEDDGLALHTTVSTGLAWILEEGRFCIFILVTR